MSARPALKLAVVACLVVSSTCGTKVVDFGPAPPDASPVVVRPMCGTEAPPGPAGADPSQRCLVCSSMKVACLICKTDPGTDCGLCYWDDSPDAQCKRCLGPNGMIVDGCDELRPELVSADKISNGAGSSGLSGQAPR